MMSATRVYKITNPPFFYNTHILLTIIRHETAFYARKQHIPCDEYNQNNN